MRNRDSILTSIGMLIAAGLIFLFCMLAIEPGADTTYQHYMIGAIAGLAVICPAAIKTRRVYVDYTGAVLAAVSILSVIVLLAGQSANPASPLLRALLVHLRTPEMGLLIGFAITSMPLRAGSRNGKGTMLRSIKKIAVYICLAAALVLFRNQSTVSFDAVVDPVKIMVFSALTTFTPIAFCLLPDDDVLTPGKPAAAVLLIVAVLFIGFFAWQTIARDNLFKTNPFLQPACKGVLILSGLCIKKSLLTFFRRKKSRSAA